MKEKTETYGHTGRIVRNGKLSSRKTLTLASLMLFATVLLSQASQSTVDNYMLDSDSPLRLTCPGDGFVIVNMHDGVVTVEYRAEDDTKNCTSQTKIAPMPEKIAESVGIMRIVRVGSYVPARYQFMLTDNDGKALVRSPGVALYRREGIEKLQSTYFPNFKIVEAK